MNPVAMSAQPTQQIGCQHSPVAMFLFGQSLETPSLRWCLGGGGGRGLVLNWYPKKEGTSALCLYRPPSLCVRRPKIPLQTLTGAQGGPSVSHPR